MILIKRRSLQQMQSNRRIFFLVFILISLNFFIYAYDTNRSFKANEIPQELKGIQIDEKLGGYINKDLSFINDDGQPVRLANYFNQKPVLFTIIYYKCPNLCQLHLNGLFKSINGLSISPEEFEFVALSMDHTETPRLASEKKNTYLSRYKNQKSDNWHFLTGDEKNIKKVSDQVGFRFKWNEKEKQFAHLPVAYILTPEAQISRYIYGVEVKSKTLNLSLVEASQGRVGGVFERILLFCFQFDPRKNRYTLYAYNLMKAAGVVTILFLLALLIPSWLRAKKVKV